MEKQQKAIELAMQEVSAITCLSGSARVYTQRLYVVFERRRRVSTREIAPSNKQSRRSQSAEDAKAESKTETVLCIIDSMLHFFILIEYCSLQRARLRHCTGEGFADDCSVPTMVH
jgi:hypothetical protein